MKEIAPNIWVEYKYPPYNLVLIGVDKGAVVVDLPPRPSHTQQWLEEAKAKTGTIKYIVLTNASPERQVAAALCDIPIIAAEATLRAIAGRDERAWRELMQKVTAPYPEEAETLPDLSPHRVTLSFNRSFMMHATTPPMAFETVAGAKPGSLWLTIPEQHLLFAGDTVIVEEPPCLAGVTDINAWRHTLKQLSNRRKIHEIVPGRGTAPILRGDIEQQREFLRVLSQTAQTLADIPREAINFTEPAQDLGQAFFNPAGQKAVKRIRHELECLVEKIKAAQASVNEEENEDSE